MRIQLSEQTMRTLSEQLWGPKADVAIKEIKQLSNEHQKEIARRIPHYDPLDPRCNETLLRIMQEFQLEPKEFIILNPIKLQLGRIEKDLAKIHIDIVFNEQNKKRFIESIISKGTVWGPILAAWFLQVGDVAAARDMLGVIYHYRSYKPVTKYGQFLYDALRGSDWKDYTVAKMLSELFYTYSDVLEDYLPRIYQELLLPYLLREFKKEEDIREVIDYIYKFIIISPSKFRKSKGIYRNLKLAIQYYTQLLIDVTGEPLPKEQIIALWIDIFRRIDEDLLAPDIHLISRLNKAISEMQFSLNNTIEEHNEDLVL